MELSDDLKRLVLKYGTINGKSLSAVHKRCMELKEAVIQSNEDNAFIKVALYQYENSVYSAVIEELRAWDKAPKVWTDLLSTIGSFHNVLVRGYKANSLNNEYNAGFHTFVLSWEYWKRPVEVANESV